MLRYFRKETSLVVLRNSSELIVAVKASELLHPMTVNPFSAPHFQQRLICSLIVSIIELVGYPVTDIHQLVYIYL